MAPRSARPRRGSRRGGRDATVIAMAPTAVLALALVVAAWASPARAADDLWALLRDGRQVVLLRHGTTTPGVGDPPGFRLDDCATQRNLTDAGREEARRIGAAFRAQRVPVGRVLSSPWCRCLETARLAFGRAEPWPALANLFGRQDRADAFRAAIAEPPSDGTLVLVSHGSTISAVTGVMPAMGEFLVVTPEGGGRFKVAGRIPSPDLP
jgi:phosphohistidine phosphatase SixA